MTYYPPFNKEYEDFLESEDYKRYLEEIKVFRMNYENNLEN